MSDTTKQVILTVVSIIVGIGLAPMGWVAVVPAIAGLYGLYWMLERV